MSIGNELTGAVLALCGIAMILTVATSVAPDSAFRHPRLNIAAGTIIAAFGITYAVIG